jgi:acyl-CoA synthetase (AMP-forming)/AMP-acid ligase II
MTAQAHLADPVHLLDHGDKRFHFPSLGQTLAYGELYERARSVARALRRRGLRDEELVGLLFSTCPEFLIAFFGVLMGGGAIVPLPLPTGASALGAYYERLLHLLRSGEVRCVIAGDELAASADVLPDGITVVRVGDLRAEADGRSGFPHGHEPPVGRPLDPGRLALVQYTSGSTSEPMGVALTHANLSAGLTAIARGIALRPDDVNGQWLPLHHDMGLIGLLAGIAHGVTHHLWSPQAFVRNPASWLSEFAARRGTVYAGPNFSYASMLARTSDEHLRALDLSAWRIAFNGAEVIDPSCLREFTRRFAAAGVRPEVMFPVYGLAEATLAVTFPRLGSVPVVDWVDRAQLADGRVFVPAQPGAPGARGLVSVGAPVLGHEVRVTGGDGEPLPEGAVGQIEVRGPAVMTSYWKMTPGESQVAPDGWFQTGDLGAMVGGELRVCGRLKEMIVVRGANFYPHDVEAVVGRLPGVHSGRAVAFAVDEPGQERIVVLVEAQGRAADDLPARAAEQVLEELGLAHIEVLAVRPRSLARTTSGKLRRMAMRQRYLSRSLELASGGDEATNPAVHAA